MRNQNLSLTVVHLETKHYNQCFENDERNKFLVFCQHSKRFQHSDVHSSTKRATLKKSNCKTNLYAPPPPQRACIVPTIKIQWLLPERNERTKRNDEENEKKTITVNTFILWTWTAVALYWNSNLNRIRSTAVSCSHSCMYNFGLKCRY